MSEPAPDKATCSVSDVSLSYEIFYRDQLVTAADWAALPSWDVFVSAYNSSERVRRVYDQISTGDKYWVIHPEYQLIRSQLPPERQIEPPSIDESTFIIELFSRLTSDLGKPLSELKLCIDITGLMRPHLLFMVQYLNRKGVRKFHVIYSEPERYAAKERTAFSVGDISVVRPVHGYEGTRSRDNSNDVLIIGMGYDHRMVAEVAEEKDQAQKIQLFGLPPLRADMYQESVLRSRRVADALADPQFSEGQRANAPASDPFATAAVLREVVAAASRSKPITNLYLSPLGTKAQTLGFALYYIGEWMGRSASVIFPFSQGYTPETSYGMYKAWCYTLEFPLF